MIELEPFTPRQAKKSALVVGAVLAVIASWQAYRGRPVAAQALAASAVVLAICAAITPAAVAFHRVWMTLAGVLGYINSRILLSLTFYLVITPIGVVRRALGHDPLQRRQAPEPTYWRRRSQSRQTRDGYGRAY